MTPATSLDTTPAGPADANGSRVMTSEPSLDAAADADEVGDEAVDDPADADAGGWVRVCPVDRLTPDRGMAALVGGQQVAVYRLSGDRGVFAIGNRDPFSGANVLSRGIIGDANGVPKVASPVYKQGFDLRTGQCLDDPEVTVPAYQVRIEDGWILVEAPGGSP